MTTQGEEKKQRHVEIDTSEYDTHQLVGATSVKFSNAKLVFCEPLPDSVEEVTFGLYFNQPLPQGFLNKVKSVDFGWNFNQVLSDEILPEQLETLTLGYWYKQDLKLSARNIKRIQTNHNYKGLVTPEILKLMPEDYQKLAENIRKNHEITAESCYTLAEEFFAPFSFHPQRSSELSVQETEHDLVTETKQLMAKFVTRSEEETGENQTLVTCIDKLKEIINQLEETEEFKETCTDEGLRPIERTIKRHFKQDGCYTLDNLGVLTNTLGQVVIDMSFSYWSSNHVVYVGQNGIYYRTFWRHINIPKPYMLYTDDTIVGPFTLESLLDNLVDG